MSVGQTRRFPIVTGGVYPHPNMCLFGDGHGAYFGHHLTGIKPKRMSKLSH